MRTFSLLGSTYGGYALSSSVSGRPRWTIVNFLAVFAGLRAAPIALQASIVHIWHDFSGQHEWLIKNIGLCCTCCTLFCAGAITTATFTLMMHLSQRAPLGAQGTHYTMLATFEVLGKLLFASVAGMTRMINNALTFSLSYINLFAGFLIDSFGLNIMFLAFFVLAVLCVPFVLMLPKAVIDCQRRSQTKKDK
jgi:hypothetical protein